MPTIGWVFVFAAIGLIVGSLLLLRDTANTMSIPEDKLEKIRKRQAELEAEEREKEKNDL